MKSFIVISTTILICCLSITFLSLSKSGLPEKKFISIEKAIIDKQLKAEIKGLGGHSADCIDFQLKNLTKDSLFLILEPGRRLVSADSTLQDILIVREKKILLAQSQSLTLTGYGFCCEATMHSPYKNAVFNAGFMAPKEWIALAEFINLNNFPPEAIQSSIWCLSDNHSIASINVGKNPQINTLKKKVAELKKEEFPWYDIIYEKDTASLFSNRHEWLIGQIEYYISNNCAISINIRSKTGQLMKTLINGEPLNPGLFKYDLNFKVQGWPKGEYEVMLIEDMAVVKKKLLFKL